MVWVRLSKRLPIVPFQVLVWMILLFRFFLGFCNYFYFSKDFFSFFCRHLKRPPGQLQGNHGLGPRSNYLGSSPQPRSAYTNLNIGSNGTDSGFAWKKYTIAAAGGEERAISDTQSEGGRGWGECRNTQPT